MKKIIIFSYVGFWCFFCCGGRASEVWIKAPSTDFVDFEAYISTESQKTFAQHQWDKIKVSPRPVNLKTLLAKAQSEFLSHDPLSAKPTYQEIVSHSHAYEWSLEERKIIFYSFFRMAQLEKDLARLQLFLKEALVFGKDMELDFKLFPPPLIKAYQKIKKNTGFIPLHLKKIFPDHELILINGKAYKRTQKLLLPYGVYRIYALSSSHKPWTKIISLSRLVLKKIKTQALVKGKCEAAQVRGKAYHKKRIRVLFPGFCVWKGQQQASEDFKAFVPLALPSSEEEKPSQKISKKWWWVGGFSLAVLGGVSYLVWKNKKTNASSSPGSGKTPVSKKPVPQPSAPQIIQIGF